MRATTFTFHGDLMQNPQRGDTAQGPNGETATFDGQRWVVQSAPQAGGDWSIQPMQTPADQRAAASAARADAAASRSEVRDQTTMNRQGIQSETDLRKEFLAQPDAKEFPTIASSYQNVLATARNESAAGDLSLIFAFMKILDPNSVVREQEFANAQNAAGVPDQIRNTFNRALEGQRLNPKQRADFVAQAQSVYANRAERYNALASRYRGLAESYGFAPDNVALPEEVVAAQASAQAAPQEQGSAASPTETPYLPTNPDGSVTWDDLTDQQRMSIGAGQVVVTPSGERVTARGRPFVDPNTRSTDRTGGGGLNLREPNARDTGAAFVTAANEQIPFGDELSAATVGAMTGRGYSETRDIQQSNVSMLNETNRTARNAGGVAGVGAMMIAPGAATAGRFVTQAPKGMAVARGMMAGGASGAVYGAGAADGGVAERLSAARDGAVVGAMTGGALSGGARAVGERLSRPVAEGSRAAHVQTLRNNGVSMTPGQSMGGVAKSAEDLAQRAPILGPAIRAARGRNVETLNRAVGNRALDAIGEGVPANVNVGGDMVSHVQQRLGSEFDRAYAMVPDFNPNDPELVQGLTRIGQRKADLPTQMQEQFDNIVAQRVQRLNGQTTGQNVGAVRSELNQIASGYLKSQDPAQQQLGGMLAELGDELDGAISRANPEAGQILSRARDGYADYIRLERASTNAGGEAFAPGHLASAVKATDGTVRHGAVGRGDARLQDLSRAARAVMPDGFGNPGTADAVGLGGLAVGAVNAPITTGAIAAGLGAAATPYLMMGRQVLERLPANASRQQLQQAADELGKLATQDSNVISFVDEVNKRLVASSGVAATVAQPRPMTGR